MEIETKPVIGKDGEILLYDMYIDGEWCGSRRTLAQCEQVFKWVKSWSK